MEESTTTVNEPESAANNDSVSVAFQVSSQNPVTSTILDIFVDIVDWISVYYSLALIIIGCVCNPLSFIVFSRRVFRTSSTSVYLRFLSVMDLGAILTGFTRFFVLRAFEINLRQDDISCKLNLFFAGVFLYSSSWTLVAVTTERMMSIIWPHRVHVLCSRTNVRLVICVIVVFHCLFNIPYNMLTGSVTSFDPLTNMTSHRSCLVKTDAISMRVMGTVSVIELTFLPCFIIIILNIVIIYGVVKSRRRVLKTGDIRRNTFKTSTSKTAGRTAVNRSSTDMKSVSKELSFAQSTSMGASEAARQTTRNRPKVSGGSKKETSLTITLLTISTSFVVCTFPNAAYGQNLYYTGAREKQPSEVALGDLLDILMYTNNSLNFALYCITGSRFRAEVKALIKELFRSRLHK